MLLSRGCIGQSLRLYMFISEGTSTFTFPTHSIAVFSFAVFYLSYLLSVILECKLCALPVCVSFCILSCGFSLACRANTGMHVMYTSSLTFYFASWHLAFSLACRVMYCQVLLVIVFWCSQVLLYCHILYIHCIKEQSYKY